MTNRGGLVSRLGECGEVGILEGLNAILNVGTHFNNKLVNTTNSCKKLETPKTGKEALSFAIECYSIGREHVDWSQVYVDKLLALNFGYEDSCRESDTGNEYEVNWKYVDQGDWVSEPLSFSRYLTN